MFPLLLLIAIILLLVVLINHLRECWDHYKASRNIPGEMFLPIIGNIPQLLRKSKTEIVDLLIELGQRSDSIYRLWLGTQFVVIVSSPEDCKTTLSRCLNRSKLFDDVVDFLGKGLAVHPKEVWKGRRKLIQQTVNAKQVASFNGFFNESVDKMLNELAGLRGQSVDFLQIISRYTLAEICYTTMGLEVDGNRSESLKFVESFSRLIKFGSQLQTNPLLKWNPFYKKTHLYKEYHRMVRESDAFVLSMIRERTAKIKSSPGHSDAEDEVDAKKPLIFIDQLLRGNADGTIITEQEILDESKTMLIAGFETTSTTTSLALLMLAQNPLLQQQVFQEIIKVSPDHGDISVEKCNAMEKLNRVIKETLRLYPTLALLGRDVDVPLKLSGRQIPKGTQVLVSLLSLQRSTRFWGPTAKQFDSDRFLPQNIPEDAANMFLPFGGMPRDCVGMRYAASLLKVTLAKIIRRFDVRTSLKFEDIQISMNSILRCENEHLMEFREREKFPES